MAAAVGMAIQRPKLSHCPVEDAFAALHIHDVGGGGSGGGSGGGEGGGLSTSDANGIGGGGALVGGVEGGAAERLAAAAADKAEAAEAQVATPGYGEGYGEGCDEPPSSSFQMLRITCPKGGDVDEEVGVGVGVDVGAVCDVLLELGCLSASVAVDDCGLSRDAARGGGGGDGGSGGGDFGADVGGGGGQGAAFLETDEEFDRTGQVDLSVLANPVIEAWATESTDSEAIGAALQDIFATGSEPWRVEVVAPPSMSALEAAGPTEPMDPKSDSAMTEVVVGEEVLLVSNGNYLAFGDGKHSSSRLCLSYLGRLGSLADARVLDFGAGTVSLGPSAASTRSRTHVRNLRPHTASV